MKASIITKLLAVVTLSSSIASAAPNRPRMLRTGAPACGNLKDDTPACDRVRAQLQREVEAANRVEAKRVAQDKREEARRVALERRTRKLLGLPEPTPELAISVAAPRTYENGAPANGNVHGRSAPRKK